MGEIKEKNYTKGYVIANYLAFWIGILIVVGIYLVTKNETIMSVSTIPLSWIPTIVLLVMFNKLIPNKSRKQWIKESFSARINFRLVLVTGLVFVFSIVLTYVIMLNNKEVLSLNSGVLSFGGIITEIFICIITGAMGEELGWRAYLQRHFEEKNEENVIKSAIKVGLIWCFWHTLLWFVSAASSLVFLLNYIATFVIMNMCLSIVIAICYKRCRNIFIPMWVHFLSNVTMSIVAPLFTGDSAITIAKWILSLLYIIIMLLFVLWYKKSERNKVLNQ